MRYRRANVPGATYFFTVNLADRKAISSLNKLICSVVPYEKSGIPILLIFLRWWYCPIICMPFGACQKTMPISRYACL